MEPAIIYLLIGWLLLELVIWSERKRARGNRLMWSTGLTVVLLWPIVLPVGLAWAIWDILRGVNSDDL